MERADEVRMETVCGAGALPAVAAAIQRVHPYEEPAWDVYPLAAKPTANTGQGRLVTLRRAVSVKTLVDRVKKHLKLGHVRLAKPAGRSGSIKTIALCAGAGGSVIANVEADAYLTGEMRHHDTLAAAATGTAVILCDHTNTERGYLPVLKRRLAGALDNAVEVTVSRRDREPLEIV